MGSFSIWHWLIVLLVVLLIFGPKKLSEVGKGLGEGMKNFKKGLNDDEEQKEQKEQKPPSIEASKSSKDEAENDTKAKDNDRAAS